MNETPAPLRVSRDHDPRPLLALGAARASRANARRSWPSQRATAQPNARSFSSRSPRSLTCETHVSDCTWLRSTITVISCELPVRGRLERLPELALLELAVAGEHVDAPRAAEHAVGEHEAARLRDAHPERAGARHHLGRRGDVGMAGQAVEAAQLVDQVEVEPAERGQHRVQAGDVVALRREVAVAVAEHLQVEPDDDVERAERRPGMARAGALDHVERVQPAGVGERGGALDRVGVERADAVALGLRHVAKAHRERA